MSADRVRVGVAGLGRMGRIHAANLAGPCRVAELACVFDADPAAAREVSERYGVPCVPSYDDLLEDESVQAVAVATPTGSHAELSVRAARAGRHVFCEKPLSLDRASTVQTVEALRDVVFQVGFHRRYDPDWVAARDRISAGELGEVYLLRTSLRDMRPPRPEFLAGSGGFFVDMTIHDLDTARWLAGEVTEVTAHGASLSPGFAEALELDTVVVVLRFESGALGVIDNSRAAGYGYECSTEVMGSLATVRIDAPRRHGYQWRTPGSAAFPLVQDFEQRFPVAYAAELDAFATCVRDGGAPRASGLDALAAFDLAQAAGRSWSTGATVAVSARRVTGGVVYGP